MEMTRTLQAREEPDGERRLDSFSGCRERRHLAQIRELERSRLFDFRAGRQRPAFLDCALPR